MGKCGQGRIKGVEDVDLSRSVEKVVIPANDMGDLHIKIIHHYSKIIGRGTIAAGDDQIIHLLIADHHPPLDQIIDHYAAVDGVAKTDNRLNTWARIGIVATAAVITGFLTPSALLLTHLVNLILRTPAVVGLSLIKHLLSDLTIAVEALALEKGALIRIKTKPVHALQDDLCSSLGGAFLVGVLYPENKLTTLSSGLKPGVECGTDTTNMEVARRARGKSGTDGHGLS